MIEAKVYEVFCVFYQNKQDWNFNRELCWP